MRTHDFSFGCWVFVFILAVSVATVPCFAATELTVKCTRAAVPAAKDVQCDVRSTDYRDISAVAVKAVDDKDIPSTFDPFNFKLRTSAWLFVVQTTSHPQDAKREIERVIKPEGKRRFGIATFSDQLDVLAPVGADETERRHALEEIPKVQVRSTALYGAARQGILRLAEHAADRRALVMIADGRSDRDAYGENDVVELAKQNNIVVFTIAMTSRDGKDANQNLQGLRQLAEKTGGTYFDAGVDRRLSSDDVAHFSDYLENGGMVKVANADVGSRTELSFVATASDDGHLKADKIAIGAGPIAPVITPPVWQPVVVWSETNPVWAATGAALVATVVGLGLMLTLRGASRRRPAEAAFPNRLDDGTHRRRLEKANANSETIILTPTNDRNPPSHVYAWLQFLDANSTRVPIGSTSVRIGRHEDNDISLANNSVHRQHAVLHMGQDRNFTVRDLDTKNGVMVNSKRITQKQLADGDLIEFGEVRARFFANHDTVH